MTSMTSTTPMTGRWAAPLGLAYAPATDPRWLAPNTLVAAFAHPVDASRAAEVFAGGLVRPAVLEGPGGAALVRAAYERKPRLARTLGVLGDEARTTEELAQWLESGAALVTVEAWREAPAALDRLGAAHVLRVGRWITERVG